MKSEDATKELIEVLDQGREMATRIYSPENIRAQSDSIHSLTEWLKATENVLYFLDTRINVVEKSPNVEVFKEFIKYRDLLRDFIRILKLKVDTDKEFVSAMDAILYWAQKPKRWTP